MINEYPIFVISYNRAINHKTSKKLAEFGVNHYLVLHKEQIEEYKKYFTEAMKAHTIIIAFDDEYKLKYETCDAIPHIVKNAGSGAERNFAWDYAKNVLKTKAHWLMDDNMGFYYIAGKNSNGKSYIRKPCTKEKFIQLFHKAEDFYNRYENLLMIELTQNDFSFEISKLTYSLNTRCFSCNLICNDMPLRWRGRYNEDVILSYDIMTAGYCIASYKAGIRKAKESTRNAKGGNHATKKGDMESIYQDGLNYKYSSEAKTNLLLKVYPQYFEKIIKYGRIHHKYLKHNFKQKLIKAQVYGEKRYNFSDFKKVKHYPIPQGEKQ